jgi:hypothetical protein
MSLLRKLVAQRSVSQVVGSLEDAMKQSPGSLVNVDTEVGPVNDSPIFFFFLVFFF